MSGSFPQHFEVLVWVNKFLNHIQANLFYSLWVQGGIFRDPLWSQEPLKLAKRNSAHSKYYLRPSRIQKIFRNLTYDVITRNNGKIRTFAKPGILYIIRKVAIRAFRKCNAPINCLHQGPEGGRADPRELKKWEFALSDSPPKGEKL